VAGTEDALWAAMRRLNERLLLAQDEANLAQSGMPPLETKIADIERARQALLNILSPGTATVY